MTTLWTLGGLSLSALARRVWREIVDDHIFGRSAELAYYFLFSLFPLLLFLIAVFGYFVSASAELRRELFDYLRAVIPSRDALSLVRNTLQEIIDRRGLRFSFGLIFSLWAAAQGVAAVGRVLDTAYEVEDKRPLWRSQLMAIALTVACLTLLVSALVLIFYGGEITQLLERRLLFGKAFVTLWSYLQWPVALVFLIAAFELIYNFAPAQVSRQRLHWTSPGAVAGVTLWLVASYGLRAYLARFDVYAWAYGSLGALIVLMLWFYVGGFAILVGGEINAEILKAVEQQRVARRRAAAVAQRATGAG